jgi:enamine deaminase RidA (YjgF/YER057c/UK114 family)
MVLDGYDYIGYEFHAADREFREYSTLANAKKAMKELEDMHTKQVAKYRRLVKDGLWPKDVADLCLKMAEECNALWADWFVSVLK